MARMTPALWLGAGLAAAVVAGAGHAAAQQRRWDPPAPPVPAAQLAQARRDFAAGLDAARDDQWQEAARKFERAYALSGEHIALYNLGLAFRALGRVVDARDAFAQAREPGSTLSASRARDASRYMAEATSRIATLEIDGLPRDPLEVSVSGGRVRDARARPLVVELDRGARSVVVSRSGQRIFRWAGALASGEHARVSVPVAARAQPGAQHMAADAGPAWPAIGSLVASGALAVGGAVLLVLGALANSDVSSAPDGTRWDDVAGAYQRGPILMRVGAVLAGVSLVGAVVGGVLLLEGDGAEPGAR